MPKISEIATLIITKTSQKSKGSSKNTTQVQPLKIKNKLKTQVSVGDESKLEKFRAPSENDEIFASWQKELNKKAAKDCFEREPLNKVKTPDNDDINALEREIRYRNWLQDVYDKMKTLGFKN